MRAADLDELIATPAGHYFVDEKFICWCLDRTLFGCVYWGKFGRADAERVVRVLDAELHPSLDGHASLADMRRVEAATPGAFEVLASYLASRREQLARSVGRQAILRPDGMLGSVVAGFYEVHASPYPARSFSEPGEAFSWLGLADGPSLLAELESLRDVARDVPAVVRDLRRVLRTQLPEPCIERTAKELGVSTRTLQRRLGEADTSFRAEIGRVRVEAAKALLVETNDSLAAIAHEVGCASSQHMSVLFRRFTGRPPSAWRRDDDADADGGC